MASSTWTFINRSTRFATVNKLASRVRLTSSTQGLDVQEDIAEGKVTPGRFFVLKFDFSPAGQSQPKYTGSGSRLKTPYG